MNDFPNHHRILELHITIITTRGPKFSSVNKWTHWKILITNLLDLSYSVDWIIRITSSYTKYDDLMLYGKSPKELTALNNLEENPI